MANCILSPFVAYASIFDSKSAQDPDIDLLRHWCAKLPTQVDVLTDDVHPTAPNRPQWAEILEGMKRGEINTVIVPRLFHIAGDNVVALATFLTLLKRDRVVLKSLVEVIDSRRVSGSEIVIRLLPDDRTASIDRGA